MLNQVIDIFTAPAVAFENLRERAPFLPPMLLIVLSATALNAMYFSLVDPEFLVEDILRRVGDDLSREEEQRIRDFGQGDRSNGRWFALLGPFATTSLILLLQAAYFSIVSLASGHGITYRRWLGMVSWASLPAILPVLGGAVALYLSPGYELGFRELNPLSLASLLNLETGRGASRLLDRLDIAQFWTTALLAIGYRCWTDSTWHRSLTVAAAPIASYYGVSLAFLL
ncbi:MAG: YIP1 family protein [Pseudomonadota bacterium]